MALPNAVSGALSSATNSQATPFAPYVPNGIGSPAYFNLVVSGTFSATYNITRSVDGGATWVPLTAQGSVVSITTAMSEVLVEGMPGALYAVNVTSYTSGTLNYAFKQ